MANWFSKLIGREDTSSQARKKGPVPPPLVPQQTGSSPLQVGGVLLNEFEVERELGRGGMGKVYLVRSRITRRNFAVKEVLVKDEAHRRAFLAELQTWIDLPEHPNILACRFFRTVGDEILIFADYIEGGSLAEWITQGKLTSVERKLDVAIQFAWGLHAIHEHGLIHQDVKPGNVLMTKDGIPKVADFGLARAKQHGSIGTPASGATPMGQESLLVSSGGMTPAYASPEQRAGHPISRKTDIWSWGVSVLDMFAGEVSCPHGGHIAAEVLESFTENGRAEDNLPEMPTEVTSVLLHCFARNPTDRWETLREAAEALVVAFAQITDRNYSLTPPSAAPQKSQSLDHKRRIKNVTWKKPEEWLREAYRAMGTTEPKAKLHNSHNTVGAKAAGVADLVGYEEAERLLALVCEGGNPEHLYLLARLYADKALLLFSLDDKSGAIQAHDQCIRSRELLAKGDGRAVIQNDLASAYLNKAIVLRNAGDSLGAEGLYDRCIAIRERLVQQSGETDFADDLALSYMNKACDVASIGGARVALGLFDRSIAIYQRLVAKQNRAELADDLAHAYMNKAGTLQMMGDLPGAVKAYDACIEIRQRLVESEGRSELANDLAAAFMGKAAALNDLGESRPAIQLHDRCIAIRERLLNDGHHEFHGDLAAAHVNKGSALQDGGDAKGASEQYGRAISIYEKLVEQEGRLELANFLATAYMNLGNAKGALGDPRGRMECYDRCISMRKRLVKHGREDAANDLAAAYMNKANAIKDSGAPQEAISSYDQCIAIREQLVGLNMRAEVADGLAMAYLNKAAALKSCGMMEDSITQYDKGIHLYHRLIQQDHRIDLTRHLVWGQLSRASVLLEAGKLTGEERKCAKEAFRSLLQEVERIGSEDNKRLVEWSNNELGSILCERELDYRQSLLLPSGLKVSLALNAILDLNSKDSWYNCPSGDFWFITPNLSVASPPYLPTQEIVCDYLSAPVPGSREEAMEYVHVYVDDSVNGPFWRGDWMDTFHVTYPLSAADKAVWRKWVSERGNFLNALIRIASKQADRAARGWKEILTGEGMRGYAIKSKNVPKQSPEAHGNLYSLSQRITQCHRLPSSLKQRDYDAAVNVVASDLKQKGMSVLSAERDRSAPYSLVAQGASRKVAVKITVVWAPNEPTYTPEQEHDLQAFARKNNLSCAMAPVGFASGAARSPEGHRGFYVKFGGIVAL